MNRFDELLKDAAPIRDEQVARLTLDGEDELLQALLADERPAAAAQGADRADDAAHAVSSRGAVARGARGGATRRARPRITRARVAGLTLAGALAVGAFALSGISLTGGGELRTGPDQVWAAQALRVAGAVPRIAIGQEGWRVVRADEFQVDDGEMEFARGSDRATLMWRPRATQDDYTKDRAASADRLPAMDVLGSPAAVFRYRGGVGDDLTAIWGSGRYSLELRVTAGRGSHVSDAQFTAVLRSLKLVSVDAWLGAMPASVVLPQDRDSVVRAMLRGLPLPQGFEAAKLSEGDAVRDRYQLGAAVSGAVACGWIEQWLQAGRDGDAGAAQAASDALLTSHRWPILNEMSVDGDYPEVLWEFADAIAGDGKVAGSRTPNVEQNYRPALGCG